jgi:Kinesin motor domain
MVLVQRVYRQREGPVAAMGTVAAVGTDVSSSTAASDHHNRRVASNIRVVARIRPMTQDENGLNPRPSIHAIEPKEQPRRNKSSTRQEKTSSSRNSQSAQRISSSIYNNNDNDNNVSMKTTNSTRLVAGTENRFHLDFDTVFAPNATQKDVYDFSVGDTIRQELFQGYNTTIIAVGQKSSGKSHTWSGGWATDAKSKTKGQDQGSGSIAESDGILPRAIHDLFQTAQHHEKSSGTRSLIRMSFLEISSKGVKDVLAACDTASRNTSLEFQDSGSFEATKIAWVTVDTPVQVKVLISMVYQQRFKHNQGGSTMASHLICRFHITIVRPASSLSGSSSEKIITRLTLANLSGPDQSANPMEGGSQNDMQVFGNIITSLSENPTRKRSSMPYSDSVLTKILRNALGGKC